MKTKSILFTFILLFIFLPKPSTCCWNTNSIIPAEHSHYFSTLSSRDMEYSPVVSKIKNTIKLQEKYEFNNESATLFIMLKNNDYHSLVDARLEETTDFRNQVESLLYDAGNLLHFQSASNQEEIIGAFQYLLQNRHYILNQALEIAAGMPSYGILEHYFTDADSTRIDLSRNLIEIIDASLKQKMTPDLKEELSRTSAWKTILSAFSTRNNALGLYNSRYNYYWWWPFTLETR